MASYNPTILQQYNKKLIYIIINVLYFLLLLLLVGRCRNKHFLTSFLYVFVGMRIWSKINSKILHFLYPTKEKTINTDIQLFNFFVGIRKSRPTMFFLFIYLIFNILSSL